MLHTYFLRLCSHIIVTVGSNKYNHDLWQKRIVNAQLLLDLLNLPSHTKAIYFWHLNVGENESVANVAASLGHASIVHINSSLPA